MATCTDNPALGVVGCGATFSGERQHCVARVDWSDHPDGRAHITGALSTIDKCWKKGKGDKLAHPSKCGFVELRPGYWGQPQTSPDWGGVISQSDETGVGGTSVPQDGSSPVLAGDPA